MIVFCNSSLGEVCDELASIGTEPLNATKLFMPHAVIIDLGQNDYGMPGPHLPKMSFWVASYTNFVRQIISTYEGGGSALSDYAPPQFFLSCGGMDTKYCADTQAAVRSMTRAGMANVHFLDVSAAGAGGGKNLTTEGCPGTPGSHPSWRSHLAMADAAEPLVAKTMGWQ